MKTILFIAMALAISCSNAPTETSERVRVDLHDSEFGLQEPIAVTIVNESEQVLSFFHCDFRIALFLQRRETGAWTDVQHLNGPPCLAIYMSGQLVLNPGESKTGDLSRLCSW